MTNKTLQSNKVDRDSTRLINFGGRRITNAQDAVHDGDYVTLKQVTKLFKQLQPTTKPSTTPKPGSSGGGGGSSGGGWASLFPNIQSPLRYGFSNLNTGNNFKRNDNIGQNTINVWQAGTPTSFLFNVLIKSIPASPYTIDMGIVPNFGTTTASINGFATGMLLRDSNTDHVINWCITATVPGSANARLSAWNSTTTGSFATDYLGTGTEIFNRAYQFYRVVEDGVHRTFYCSSDNQYWEQVLQQASGTFITPNQIGFFILTGNVSESGGAMLFHYLEH